MAKQVKWCGESALVDCSATIIVRQRDVAQYFNHTGATNASPLLEESRRWKIEMLTPDQKSKIDSLSSTTAGEFRAAKNICCETGRSSCSALRLT